MPAVIMRLATFLAMLIAMASAMPASAADVTFVLVNDIYHFDGADGRGGYARLAGVVDAERAKGGTVIYAHAGDTLSPSLLSGFDHGKHAIALLNLAPPDVFVPGNHEFDFGKDEFLKRMAEAKFPKLAANLRGPDGALLDGFADTRIIEAAGVKIGIIGLAADDSPVKSNPEDLKFTPAVDTAFKEARKLRDDGADFIVLVTHTDRGKDWAMARSGAFDLILTGDDHDLLVSYDGRTAMVESKEDAEVVTAVDIDFDVSERDGRRRVKWWPNFRVIDTATVERQPAAAAMVKELEKELSKELDVEIGTTTTELDSRRAVVRAKEAAIGNLIADAMRAATGADIAITNGGGIRANRVYGPGTRLTRRDILSELPFGNVDLMFEVDGKTVQAALENGFSRTEDGAGRFPQVSGLTVVADTAKPAGSRVVSVMVGDAPLDPARTYKLATNDFMARGGDGYTMFRKAKPVIGPRDAKLIANDVMVFIRKAGTLAYKPEGRITLK